MNAPVAWAVAVARAASELAQRAGRCGPVVAAIDGLGSSGKTSFADAVTSALRRADVTVTVLRGNDFLRPAAEHDGTALDARHDGRALAEALLVLRTGRSASFHPLDGDHDARSGRPVTVPCAEVVILEGVHVARRELRPLLDYIAWIDCAPGVRLERSLARDGQGARARWEEEWMPAEAAYAKEHDPAAAADLVVEGAPTRPFARR